jgi:hypothetical protein
MVGYIVLAINLPKGTGLNFKLRGFGPFLLSCDGKEQIVGQLVITQAATETNEINISKLSKGVYSVKFNGVSQKLVVK